MHAEGLVEDAATKAEIMKTVVSLRELLDVPQAFDLVIHDPAGKSEFKPMDRGKLKISSVFVGLDFRMHIKSNSREISSKIEGWCHSYST